MRVRRREARTGGTTRARLELRASSQEEEPAVSVPDYHVHPRVRQPLNMRAVYGCRAVWLRGGCQARTAAPRARTHRVRTGAPCSAHAPGGGGHTRVHAPAEDPEALAPGTWGPGLVSGAAARSLRTRVRAGARAARTCEGGVARTLHSEDGDALLVHRVLWRAGRGLGSAQPLRPHPHEGHACEAGRTQARAPEPRAPPPARRAQHSCKTKSATSDLQAGAASAHSPPRGHPPRTPTPARQHRGFRGMRTEAAPEAASPPPPRLCSHGALGLARTRMEAFSLCHATSNQAGSRGRADRELRAPSPHHARPGAGTRAASGRVLDSRARRHCRERGPLRLTAPASKQFELFWGEASRRLSPHAHARMRRHAGSLQRLLGGAVVLGLLASVAGDLTAEDLVYSDAWGTQSACSGCSYVKGHVVEKPQEEVLKIDCICPPQVLAAPAPAPAPSKAPALRLAARARPPLAMAFLALCPPKRV